VTAASISRDPAERLCRHPDNAKRNRKRKPRTHRPSQQSIRHFYSDRIPGERRGWQGRSLHLRQRNGTISAWDGSGNTPGGLWALNFGTGGSNGSPDTLYFTDGINGQADGLFGAISPVTVITIGNASDTFNSPDPVR